MAKKYYAVRRGLTPGIYLTWADCKKNTEGYSSAEFKGFDTLQEAEEYLGGDNVGHEPAGADAPCTSSGLGVSDDGIVASGSEVDRGGVPALSSASVLMEVAATAHAGEAVAYVDGSYRADTKEYACGAVLIYDGREEHFSKKYSDPEMAKMRNVAGEIMGSVLAMRYCIDRHIPKLVIYHDYEGIARWCTGSWKATKPGTASYRDFYKKASEQVQIRFVKVKGHSGNAGNELADQLAKAALGIEKA